MWKKQKQSDEIAWDSPWGKGRPGWHIECSVMSTKYLGDTIDIHGGGQDLEFPHHENEIAQSEAKTGKKFVNYWMHNGFVTVGKDEQKMSKSLHNFVTVHDILKRVDPQVLRFFMASVQYRKPINYSEENLKQAAIILDKIKNTVLNVQDKLKETNSQENQDLTIAIEDSENRFKEAMDDDFNVQNALSVVYDLLPVINKNISEDTSDLSALRKFLQHLEKWLAIFGVDIDKLTTEKVSDDDAEIEELVKKRDEARKNKDFATSDTIRDQLAEMNIILQDTPKGTKWRRG